MENEPRISATTRNYWLVNLFVYFNAILAGLSGIYFLYFAAGYQGGRNPFYNIKVVFERATWDLIHTWTGVLLIIGLSIHFILHWKWVVSTLRRTSQTIRGQYPGVNKKTSFNIFTNIAVALAFSLTAISGLYFLFFPSHQGASGSIIVFNSRIWDLIHTWAGVGLIISAIIHFSIHWKWVTKVSVKLFQISVSKILRIISL